MCERRRYGWALALALGVVGGAGAQGLYGLGEGRATEMSLDIPVPQAALASDVLRVPGFDPARDVPAMGNWKGDMQLSGAGNCYALSNLTAYFFAKVEFVPDEVGVSWDEWDRDFSKVLRVDERSMDEIPHLLARSADDVEEHGKLRIGGFADLSEFTAVVELSRDQVAEVEELDGVEAERRRFEFSDQQESTRAFRRWAEAAQYAMQIDGDGHRYLGSMLKSGLGWVPGVNLGADAVNQDGLNIIRDRLREGRLVPIALHPAGLQFKGHVVVAYELTETEGEAVITTYDCNRPPEDGEARPTVIRLKKGDGWTYEATRDGGSRAYEYRIMTIPDPESGRSRRFLEATAGNDEEHRQRNRHLGRLLGEDSSLGDRLKGGLGFVGEVLNPF